MNSDPPKKKKGNAFFAPLYSNVESSGDLDDSPPSSRYPTTDPEDRAGGLPGIADEEFDSFGDYIERPAEFTELESFESPPKPQKQKSQRGGFIRALSSIEPVTRAVSKSAYRAVSTLGRSMSLLGEHIVDIVGPIESGVFDDWTRQEIVHVLVQDNIEVRDALTIPLNVLREEAHLFYLDRPIPPKPSPEEIAATPKAASAAEKIQSNWVSAKNKAKKKQRPSKRVQKEYQPDASTMYHRAESNMEMLPEPENVVKDEELRRGFIETANSYIYTGEDEEETPLDQDGQPVQVFALNDPWIPPSVAYAKEFANKNHPRQKVRSHHGILEAKKYSVLSTTTGRFCSLGGMGEQCDMWEEGQASELGQFGPGITVYFKFVKYCFWTFVTLSILYMVPLVGNRYGGYYADTDAVTDMALGTLGNLGGMQTNASVFTLTVENCNVDWRGKECEVARSTVALVYSSVTMLGVFVLLIGYMWLRLFESREAVILDKNTVEASDYSVKVSNLPVRCSEAELRAHFVKVLDEHGECQAVEDCTIAYDNEHEIQVYKQRGDLVKRRYRATQEYRYYKTLQITREAEVTEQQLEQIAKLRQDLTAQIHKLDAELKEYDAERKKKKTPPICAYLTFQNTLGAQMALRLYGKSWLGYVFMRHKLRFKGMRLVVTRAPEPSTIIWENLRYTPKERFTRRMGTAVISVLLLVISAFASYAPRAIGETADNAGGDDECPDGFEGWSTERQREYVEANEGSLHCYCDEQSFYTQANDSTCKKYFKTKLYAQLILFGAAFVVLIVNALIDFSIRLCARYEKHHSVDSMEQGIFIRMFITKFINMGLLFLFGGNITVLGSIFGVSLSKRTTFSHDWFITVGVNIMLVEIGNIFTIHFLKILRFVHGRYRQAQARKDPLIALTQDELNTLYLGPEFLISHRYAQVMADFSVCLLFASGLPALMFIGMANFYVAYWVDKFLFLRFYRVPPRYSLQIGSLAAALIPYAVCAHVICAIWAYGVNEELQTPNENQNDYEKRVAAYDALDLENIVTQRHILPLFAIFIALTAFILMNIFVDTVFGGLRQLLKGIFGGLLSKYEYYNELERYFSSNVQISYSRAKQRGIIKGLINYNILQNPIYKDAFAVDDHFAGKHRNLISIQKATELSYFGEDKVTSFASDPAHASPPNSPPTRTKILAGAASVDLAAGHSAITTDTDGDVVNVNPLGTDSANKKKSQLTVEARTGRNGSPASASPATKSSPLDSGKSTNRPAKFFDEGPVATSAEKPRRRKSENNSRDASITEAALLAIANQAAEDEAAAKKQKKKKRHSVNARIEGSGGGGGLSPTELQYLASLQKSHLASPMVSPRLPLTPRTDSTPTPHYPPLGSIETSLTPRHRERPSSRIEREGPLTAQDPYHSRNASPMVSPRIDPSVRYGDMSPRDGNVITPRRHEEEVISAPRRNSERRNELTGGRTTPRGDDELISAPRRNSERRGEILAGRTTPRRHEEEVISAPRRNSERRNELAGGRTTPRGDDELISAPRRNSERRGEMAGRSTPRGTDDVSSSRQKSEYRGTPRNGNGTPRREYDDRGSRRHGTPGVSPRVRDDDDYAPSRRASAAASTTPRDSVSTPDRKSKRRSSASPAVSAEMPSPRDHKPPTPREPMSYEDIIRSYEHIDEPEEEVKPVAAPRPGRAIPPLSFGIAGLPARTPSPAGGENHLPPAAPPSRLAGDGHQNGDNRQRLGGDDVLEESNTRRW